MHVIPFWLCLILILTPKSYTVNCDPIAKRLFNFIGNWLMVYVYTNNNGLVRPPSFPGLSPLKIKFDLFPWRFNQKCSELQWQSWLDSWWSPSNWLDFLRTSFLMLVHGGSLFRWRTHFCKECKLLKLYIGETRRRLSDLFQEHVQLRDVE